MFKSDLLLYDCFEFFTTHYYYGLQRLLYFEGSEQGPEASLFCGISLRNIADRPVRILGSKWVVYSESGIDILEGDFFWGSHPLLVPGQIFAFTGSHQGKRPSSVSLSLIGRDDDGHIFRTPAYKVGKF